MNVLIAYATNSGSTFEVANKISEMVTGAGHQVTVKNFQEIPSADEFGNYDVVLLGSPSWDYQGNEGFPHDDFMAFKDNNASADLGGKNFVVFGLGDSQGYQHFCGAVAHIEDYVKEHNGNLKAESLRIDGYYNDMEAGNAAVEGWVNGTLVPALS